MAPSPSATCSASGGLSEPRISYAGPAASPVEGTRTDSPHTERLCFHIGLAQVVQKIYYSPGTERLWFSTRASLRPLSLALHVVSIAPSSLSISYLPECLERHLVLLLSEALLVIGPIWPEHFVLQVRVP